MEEFWQTLVEDAVAYGPKLITALIALAVGWIFAGWLGSLVRRALLRAKIDETLARFLSKLTRWGVLVLVVLGCSGIFGVETTSFAASLGKSGESWWVLLNPSRKAESFRLQKHPGCGRTSCCEGRAILLSVPQRREKADWLVPSSGH